MHEPTADETERQKIDALRLLKLHVKGELLQDDIDAEEELDKVMAQQVHAKPVQSKIRAPLFAARTLNATGQPRVTVWLR